MAFYYGKQNATAARERNFLQETTGRESTSGASTAALSDEVLEARLTEMAGKALHYKTIMTISCIIWIGLGYTAYIKYSLLLYLVNFTGFCAFVISMHFWTSVKKQMKELFSHNIVRGVLEEALELSDYAPEFHIGPDKIEMSALFKKWSKCTGSDLIKGKFKGVEFSFSDIHLEQIQKTNKGNSKRTIFKGQWLICKTNRNVPRLLRLSERSGSDKWKKSDIETESAAFNKKFHISAPDQHTAFYVLTPHFMELIMKLDKRADAQTYMSFIGPYVHIALHNGRDLFEPCEKKIYSKGNIAALRSTIKWDVRYITGIMDCLIKNEYLFKKEE